MIVSFSGIDSAGKTTQIDLLYKYLEAHHIKAKKVWSKARGTPGVLLLKQLVRRDKHMNAEEKTEYRNAVFANPRKEKLLYICSMLDLCLYWGIYYRVLALANKYLICDRYIWDTYVELHSDFKGIDIDKSKLWKLVKAVAPKPKVSFVFVVPPEVSLERDRMKNAAGIETLERKRQKIDRYFACIHNSCWTNVMDGQKPIEQLHREVLTAVGITE